MASKKKKYKSLASSPPKEQSISKAKEEKKMELTNNNSFSPFETVAKAMDDLNQKYIDLRNSFLKEDGETYDLVKLIALDKPFLDEREKILKEHGWNEESYSRGIIEKICQN